MTYPVHDRRTGITGVDRRSKQEKEKPDKRGKPKDCCRDVYWLSVLSFFAVLVALGISIMAFNKAEDTSTEMMNRFGTHMEEHAKKVVKKVTKTVKPLVKEYEAKIIFEKK